MPGRPKPAPAVIMLLSGRGGYCAAVCIYHRPPRLTASVAGANRLVERAGARKGPYLEIYLKTHRQELSVKRCDLH
jgi:hypothetical protein